MATITIVALALVLFAATVAVRPPETIGGTAPAAQSDAQGEQEDVPPSVRAHDSLSGSATARVPPLDTGGTPDNALRTVCIVDSMGAPRTGFVACAGMDAVEVGPGGCATLLDCPAYDAHGSGWQTSVFVEPEHDGVAWIVAPDPEPTQTRHFCLVSEGAPVPVAWVSASGERVAVAGDGCGSIEVSARTRQIMIETPWHPQQMMEWEPEDSIGLSVDDPSIVEVKHQVFATLCCTVGGRPCPEADTEITIFYSGECQPGEADGCWSCPTVPSRRAFVLLKGTEPLKAMVDLEGPMTSIEMRSEPR